MYLYYYNSLIYKDFFTFRMEIHLCHVRKLTNLPPTRNTQTSPSNPYKEATTPTLSGSSTITYQIGVDDQGRLFWKVSDSTGMGNFSREWILHDDIMEAMTNWPEGKPISAVTCRKLYYDGTVNTPGFLVSALKAEKLIQTMPKKQRCHIACDPAPFLAAMDKLKGKKTPARKKAPPKAKRPAARKKAPAKKK